MVACGNTGGTQGEGAGRLAAGGRVSGKGARDGWRRCRGAGLRGRTGMGGSGRTSGPGRGLSRALRVSRPGGAAARFIFTQWHLQNIAADVRRPPGSFAFCSFSLSKPAQPGAARAGSRAWEGRGQPMGVARYEAGVHWGGGRGLAGRGRRAGSGPLQSFGVSVCPQRWKLLGRGTGVCAVNHGGRDTRGRRLR